MRFPWCRRLEAGEAVDDWVTARVRCMRRQHTDAGDLLDELRRLTGDYAVPPGASAELRAFVTGLHIHKEEDVLFPRVLARSGETGDGTPLSAAFLS